MLLQSNRSVSRGISPGETEATSLHGPKEALKLRSKEEFRTPNDPKEGTCDGISEAIRSRPPVPSEVVKRNVESSDISNLEHKPPSKAAKIPRPKLSSLSKNQDSELRSVAVSKMNNKLASVEKEKNSSSVLNQRAVVLDARIQSSSTISSDPRTQIEETDLRHDDVSDSKESAGLRSSEALDCCNAESSDSKQAHPGEQSAGGISAVEAASNQNNTGLVSRMGRETKEAVVVENECVEVRTDDPRSQSPIETTEVVAPSAPK
ncbi:hypothetical protein M569_01951 [Genlisea aurea]|uniref:Uncharacterized protein n=1 Tax=Genlisea aurea TaxID=192259 RepID=S8EA78_9LAMI|nr:hypothetical protein M569_01951 [Genlisea aurea]